MVNAIRYRWVSPDGRRGRWRKTVEGAVMSAVGMRHSPRDGTVAIRFDARSAIALWPTLAAEGWSIVNDAKVTK